MSGIEEAARYNEALSGAREKCGVSAYFSTSGENVPRRLANFAEAIKNRGRDSVGMAVYDPVTGFLNGLSGPGTSSEFFTPDFDFNAHGLIGDRGISHGKYTVSRKENVDIAIGRQPVIIGHDRWSMAMAFNGNIADELRQRLRKKIPSGMPMLPDVDTYDLAQALISAPGEDWEEKFRNTFVDIPHAFSLTILTGEGRVFGIRCAEGTWPLWVGEDKDGIAFASESRVDPGMHWRSVRPGELVEATQNGVISTDLFEPREKRCFMNDAYLARRDSRAFDANQAPDFPDGVSYSKLREEMGREQAREKPPRRRRTIVGIPESGLDFANGRAAELRVKAEEWIVKREGAGKAFLLPDRLETMDEVERKFIFTVPSEHPLKRRIRKITRVKREIETDDDSTVKGNTSGGYPEQGRLGINGKFAQFDIGVHNYNGTPKMIRSCVKGLYTPADTLIALEPDGKGGFRERSDQDIAKKTSAESVTYLSIGGMLNAYEHFTGKRDNVCLDCVDRHFIDGKVKDPHGITVDPIVLYKSPAEAIARRVDVSERTAAD